jgi:hypothetical protein
MDKIPTDYYLSLLTSEHASQPQFSAVVQLLTNAVAANANLGLSLIDAFDLDKAVGAQLDAIGLWVGAFRGVPVPITGVYLTWDIPQPDVPALATTAGGTMGARTYYVRLTYVTASGESTAGPEASVAIGANNLARVTSPAAMTGATGYNVYVSTATGTETKQNGGTPIAIGTNWTEPTTGLIAGAAMPASSIGTGLGWSNGYWQGPFDPSTGIESLDDSTYRTLLRAKIAANVWDGTLATMYAFFDYVFGVDTIAIQDNQDMSMTLVYDALALNLVTKSLLTQGLFPLKPSGVRITYSPINGAPIFSWGLNTPKFQGWGTAVWTS